MHYAHQKISTVADALKMVISGSIIGLADINLKGQIYVPRLSDSKLKELSWSLDINENLNPLTGEGGKVTK